ncbi:AAA family ATPase [Abyssalbus ytuae]|uniref:ATP-binding protein n=1 Tax=Abyssalbus ytuae TaxID=2926907 RepID=A0A9E6ZW11_9FLAO|nr:ATP-binding protein [Abyssalbus ytuae]UOB17836.1 ATP-binding protein [Abyssalbus ytuae]
MKSKRIVITGGPGTGKTSIIKKLESDGYYCYHEFIRTMTKNEIEKDNSGVFNTNPVLFASDPYEFNKQILNNRILQFTKGFLMDEDIIFYDRGIPDVLAYMDYFKQIYDGNFDNACKNHRYDVAFILPPWKDIYISDEERLENFEQAVEIYSYLKNTYERFGYKLIEVPVGQVNFRADFIEDMIKNI